jgi:phosphomethylpyrimidine synthase
MCGSKFSSMKISRSITERFGPDAAVTSDDEVRAGMMAKSAEFAAQGNRVYLPIAE